MHYLIPHNPHLSHFYPKNWFIIYAIIVLSDPLGTGQLS
jgi:hypothetical protein